jgi:hypothetical protein
VLDLLPKRDLFLDYIPLLVPQLVHRLRLFQLLLDLMLL